VPAAAGFPGGAGSCHGPAWGDLDSAVGSPAAASRGSPSPSPSPTQSPTRLGLRSPSPNHKSDPSWTLKSKSKPKSDTKLDFEVQVQPKVRHKIGLEVQAQVQFPEWTSKSKSKLIGLRALPWQRATRAKQQSKNKKQNKNAQLCFRRTAHLEQTAYMQHQCFFVAPGSRSLVSNPRPRRASGALRKGWDPRARYAITQGPL
jgi:hypothetical protein